MSAPATAKKQVEETFLALPIGEKEEEEFESVVYWDDKNRIYLPARDEAFIWGPLLVLARVTYNGVEVVEPRRPRPTPSALSFLLSRMTVVHDEMATTLEVRPDPTTPCSLWLAPELSLAPLRRDHARIRLHTPWVDATSPFNVRMTSKNVEDRGWATRVRDGVTHHIFLLPSIAGNGDRVTNKNTGENLGDDRLPTLALWARHLQWLIAVIPVVQTKNTFEIRLLYARLPNGPWHAVKHKTRVYIWKDPVQETSAPSLLWWRGARRVTHYHTRYIRRSNVQANVGPIHVDQLDAIFWWLEPDRVVTMYHHLEENMGAYVTPVLMRMLHTKKPVAERGYVQSVLFAALNLQEVNSQLAKLTKKNSQLKETIAELKKHSQAAAKAAEEKRKELQAKIKEALQLRNDLVAREQRLTKAEQEVEKLGAQIATLTTDRNQLDAELATAKRDMDAREKSLAQAKQEIDTLTVHMATLTRERDAANADRTRLDAELATLKRDMDASEKNLAQAKQEIDTLTRERDAANTDRARLDAELATLKRDMDALWVTCHGREAAARTNLQKVKDDLNQAQIHADTLKQQLDDTIRLAKNQEQDYEARLKLATDQHSVTQQQRDLLKQQLQEMAKALIPIQATARQDDALRAQFAPVAMASRDGLPLRAPTHLSIADEVIHELRLWEDRPAFWANLGAETSSRAPRSFLPWLTLAFATQDDQRDYVQKIIDAQNVDDALPQLQAERTFYTQVVRNESRMTHILQEAPVRRLTMHLGRERWHVWTIDADANASNVTWQRRDPTLERQGFMELSPSGPWQRHGVFQWKLPVAHTSGQSNVVVASDATGHDMFLVMSAYKSVRGDAWVLKRIWIGVRS